MDIVCIRGSGDHAGNDIIEPLLTNVTAALSRGRKELDEGALANQQKLDCPLLDLRLGKSVQVDDSFLGVWTAKITSISHQVDIDDNGNLTATSTFVTRKAR